MSSRQFFRALLLSAHLKSAIRNSVFLFFGSILFHLAGTWSLPLIDRDEPRFAEASREMIERANYIVPYFNNQLRLDKPPLAYWAQTGSYRVFGENDFAARFPSAVAAALTALVILAWGSRIVAAKVGWSAAIIFTLSLQTFVHAKAAVADMWLVLFMTIAHWAGYVLMQRPTCPLCFATSDAGAASNVQRPTSNQGATVSKPPWAIWKSPFLVFYLSLALGFLAKGPIAWTPLLTVGVIIIYARDWQLARRFKFIRGILLTLTVIAIWGMPALIQTHGEFFTVGIGRHVIGRSLATMEGHGANSLWMYLLLLPFYFVTVFVSFFPWSIKLPWLVGSLWRRRKDGVDAPGYSGNFIDAYLLTGTAIVFIIFTLVKTKLPHYTLPAFPLLALLLAHHWQGTALSEASPAARRRALFKNIAITTACVWIAIALVVPPFVARFFPADQLFHESRAHLQLNMQFASVEFEEPSLVWYFRSRVKGFLTTLNRRRAAEFMTMPGPRFVILPTPVAETVFANPPQNWRFFPTRGFNIAKGKAVDLTLVLKPE
jgi:4-amino-4-deoxy-L-arabinose transferase-like glycosyltransferase